MIDLEPVPSTLYVFWPWKEPPTEVEIELALGSTAQRDEIPDSDDAETLWTMSFSLEGSPASVLVWACAVDERPAFSTFDDVHWSQEEREQVGRSRWLLGIETVLRADDPIAGYHRQLRLCRKVCPQSPAVYDANAYRLRSGSLVDLMTSTDIPPRTSELFRIHAVESTQEDGCGWLHTHGLARAAFPEVEILRVPSSLFHAGAWLIHNFIDRYLNDDVLPDAGKPFQVGHTLSLAWRPWDEAANELAGSAPGGPDDRLDDDAHSGVRIVLVDSKRYGWIRKRWVPPLGVMKRIDSEGAIATISHGETLRMARLARERWPELGMLFARHGCHEGWTFLVKLGYRVDGGEPHEREHLWFEVQEIVPDRLRGRLLNRPLQISHMHEDEEGWHELEMLTDWKIYSPRGEFTPENVRYVRPVESR